MASLGWLRERPYEARRDNREHDQLRSPSRVLRGVATRALTPARVRLLLVAATGLGVLPWLAYTAFYPIAIDAHAYFVAQSGNLYAGTWGTVDAYVYSPAFSQVIEPLRWLGWDGFIQAWRLLELGAMTAMAGPLIGPLLFVYPVSMEFNVGNIHALLALAVVAGFRWPAAWAFVLLTKVTPGIGLLWFVVRREWRKAAIATGATAAIVAVSFVLAPGDWLDWFRYLVTPQPPHPGEVVVTAPLWLRLIAAALLVTWGARTDRRWTVLAAAFLALPSIWWASLAMLVGLWPLWRLDQRNQRQARASLEREENWEDSTMLLNTAPALPV